MDIAKSIRIMGTLGLLSLGLFAARLPVCAQETGGLPPTQPVAGATTLSVVADTHLERIGPGAARIDFGTVDPLATPKLEHDFTFRNETQTPVEVARIQTSCGCTSVMTDKNGIGKLLPGQTLHVHVTVNLSELMSGHLTKFVWVMGSRSPSPLATIQMTVTLPTTVDFMPKTLGFGHARAGVAATRHLTVTLNPRLLHAGALPTLVSTNPEVEVHAESDAPPAAPANGKPVVAGYTVTLSSHAPIGKIMGMLFFPLDQKHLAPGASAPQSLMIPRVGAVIANTWAYLQGEVVGDISVNPDTLLFGSVNAGIEATCSVTVQGVSEAALKGLQTTCNDPWLSVRLVPATSSGVQPVQHGTPSPSLSLEATLHPDAPKGVLRSQVTVTTKSGQQILVPVIVYVVNPPPGN
ncbi:MAG TPA: DUF1573 domain-containing protein [Chthonomonadaceae bacterium]|nr:DUF1573 domain-containing protein [Chthonomonadaceae bacterium]